jgi:hypothetical protein
MNNHWCVVFSHTQGVDMRGMAIVGEVLDMKEPEDLTKIIRRPTCFMSEFDSAQHKDNYDTKTRSTT